MATKSVTEGIEGEVATVIAEVLLDEREAEDHARAVKAGDTANLAKHYMDEAHPFTACMNDPRMVDQYPDEETRRQVCGSMKSHLPAKKADAEALRSEYVNPDGSFKGGFDGCVQYQMKSKNISEERARSLCAYIGRKAGKIQ